MEVEYENEPEDIRLMTRALPSWVVAKFLFAGPFVVALTMGSPILLSRFSASHFVYSRGLWLGTTIIVWWLFWRGLKQLRRATVTPGRIRLRITPDYLEVVHHDFSSRQAWKAIDNVVRVKGATVLLLPILRCFTAPDRCFDSRETADQFFQTASEYHTAAKKSAVTESIGDDRTVLPQWAQSNPGRSVSYQNSIEQWAWALKTVGSVKKSPLAYLFPVVVCLMTNAMLGYLLLGPLFRPMRVPLDPTLATLLLVLLTITVVVSNFTTLMVLRELISRTRIPPLLLEPRTVEIFPQGMVMHTRFTLHAIRWSILGAIHHDSELTCVYDTGPMVSVMIPSSAFADSHEAETFAQEMVRWKGDASEAATITAASADDPNPYRSPHA